MKAAEQQERFRVEVDEHLRGCLPPGTPPSYTEIIGVERSFNGRQAILEAKLRMWDGEESAVRLTRVIIAGQEAWSHRWLHSRAVFFEDGRWQREAEVDLDDKVAAFLRDVKAVCRHHGFMLHPIEGRELVVEKFDPGDATLHEARIGASLDPDA